MDIFDVALAGPPFVSRNTVSKLLKLQIMIRTVDVILTGLIMGSVIFLNLWNAFAPSIEADS